MADRLNFAKTYLSSGLIKLLGRVQHLFDVLVQVSILSLHLAKLYELT